MEAEEKVQRQDIEKDTKDQEEASSSFASTSQSKDKGKAVM